VKHGEVWHKAKGEFKRVKVDEHRHEHACNIVCDQEEEQQALDCIHLPADMKVVDIHAESVLQQQSVVAGMAGIIIIQTCICVTFSSSSSPSPLSLSPSSSSLFRRGQG
jgi:hypothetical protein